MLEMLIVCALASAIGLTVNVFHPDGVVLARNYFKIGPKELPESPAAPARRLAVDEPAVEPNTPERPAPPATNPAPPEVHIRPVPSESPPPVPVETPAVSFTQDESGLNLAGFDFVFGAWSAMNAGDTSVIFVDARKADAYEDAHIAGAVLLDHYRLERYLPDLRERLLTAQVVVVYCSGDCEDSRYLATALAFDHNIPIHTLFLYEGGMTDWIEREQAVHQGAQP